MTRSLPRATPESQGLDPAAVSRLVAGLDGLEDVHSFMLLRHGAVVAEGWWDPYGPDLPHVMFSVSKSFASTAVGLAVHEGLLSLDDRVIDHLAAEAPAEPSENLAAMRVRHLLTMTSGHAMSTMEAVDTTSIGREGGDWVRQILAMPVDLEPGSRFVYNTGATYLAGVIVQRLTGQRLVDYLRPRVFDPLGITRATWEQDPDGLDVGGYGLSVTTEELAAFGQLYLQRGEWEGRQLVPAEWIDEATSAQVVSEHPDWPEWRQGYGYQFWRSRFGAYRADGAFGQYAVVWPEHDLVLAITSGIQNLQSVQDAVWAALLPTLDPGAAAEAGYAVPDAEGAPGSPRNAAAKPGISWGGGAGPAPSGPAAPREGVTWDVALRVPEGAAASPLEESVLGVTYELAENDEGLRSLTMTRDGERLVLAQDVRGTVRTAALAHAAWEVADASLAKGPVRLASAYAWADDTTLSLRMVDTGSPFGWTIQLRFDGSGASVAVLHDQNVSFGGETRLLDTTGTATTATTTAS
ncbi:serine hydrolase domain-containing protein [Antribacter gilvus]|uniref:serine hydrolase domain-containing protein n=1 Tax=Antribacter gilvus TaxID=2304675 RepID=UPI000F7B5ACE|nr:serine hydrolase domain-containing protein [Antribacter gilvus]